MTRDENPRATDGPVQDQDRFAVTEPATNGSNSHHDPEKGTLPKRPLATKARTGPDRWHPRFLVSTNLAPKSVTVVEASRARGPERSGPCRDGNRGSPDLFPSPQAVPGKTRSGDPLPDSGPRAGCGVARLAVCGRPGRSRIRNRDRTPRGPRRVPLVGGAPRRICREHPSRCSPPERRARSPPPGRGPAQVSTRLGRRRKGVIAASRRVPVGSDGQDRQLRGRPCRRPLRARSRFDHAHASDRCRNGAHVASGLGRDRCGHDRSATGRHG